MSNENIEHDGITSLRIFLGKSKIISAKINEGEKDLSWDGHLNFFKKPYHNGKKKLLFGRIPIQVKCSNRDYKETEKFSLEKADLNNYLNDGGILFIKSIYREITEYKIYVKLLLPLNIKEILSKSPADKDTVSVELKLVRNIEEFETYCKHFLENQPLQRNLKNYLNINELKNKNTKLIVKTIQRKGNEIEYLSLAELINEELNKFFDTLSVEEQKIFKSWPIWNLRKFHN
ncbi:hypothetical protein ND861_03395 [Leptospira sp. 2 VSF19]|uniref:DUF4365 domain-containing protein n=1 Tax=Leptospira soteropolitanensis TaxID=2950025 RepID=A0AAW5VGG1_9LEPT|nr:hypothetical protein [Leptospira soteropolitanensis]MCW7491690.1 hypothetical protein [Leptospira soteropolitanensis]MCW7499275.1 hypothetical protein [Leptospira soteropolitanensis]MCW7521134.1 hypothetical protein [Leptospira soteropolitanensis]MCW7525378.1 hypothetical protein [Leptospira soteropolitanensis]MCW7529245.1 hypothetical protein [Leptospira soteropolitanensis]